MKSADQTISSQTTFVNDADMRIAMAATAIYQFQSYLRYSSPTGADFKVSMSVPSGAFARYQALRVRASDGAWAGNADLTASSSVDCQGSGVGTIVDVSLIGVAYTTGTAGNLICQWAQNTSNTGSTVCYQYSYIVARRIG